MELAIEAADRDSLGIAIARSLAIADRLLEESAGWLWIGGRIPDTSGRTSRGAALLDRFHEELGELDVVEAADIRRSRPLRTAAACGRRSRPMSFRRAGIVLALVAAIAGVLAPASAAPVRAAAPGLTIVSDATYVVDPDNAAVHVTVQLDAVNHLKDTKTRLYYFDRAFLAVPPNTANFRISARAVAADGPRRLREGRPHAPPDRLRQAAAGRLVPRDDLDLRHHRPGRRPDPDHPRRPEPRRLRGVGVRERVDAGQHA